MTMGDIPDSLDELRRLAEGRAQGLDAMVDTSDHDLSDAGMRAVHELRVHKIELEMQNEQLRSVRDALEIARDSYENLFENAPAGFLSLDLDGSIVEANAAGAGLLGTSRAGLAQRPFTSFILPDDQDVFYLHCRLMFDTGEKRACELRIWRGDGSVIWIQMESSPSMDWKGCPQVLAVISDISGRKDAEAALKTIQADLEYRVMERGKELRRMALSLAMAEERERHLIAHDLHDGIEQMIHVIRLRVESLPRLGLVPEGIVAVEDLVRNLLEASRMLRSIGSRLSPPVLEKLGLAPAFSWLADFMEQDYGLHVHVESRSPPEALPHELSFILFRSVRELLINVSKHAEVREAWLSIEAVEGYLELVVEDHGRGIAAQSAQSPADARFGIRSIRDRMLQLGGRLEIDSMPGRGSRMAITVPLSPDVPDKEPRP